MATSSKLKSVKKADKPVFNPQSSYTWKADDVFAITGGQLDLLNKVLMQQIQKPEIQEALGLVECMKITSGIIQEGVEEGIIQEAPTEAAPEATAPVEEVEAEPV